MFCPNCGKEIKDGAKFCPHCGKVTEIPVGQQISNTVKKSTTQVQEKLENTTVQAVSQFNGATKRKKIIAAIAAILVLVMVLVMFSSSDINTVKSGHFSFNQNVTVEKGLENFFGSPEWDSKEVGGTHYVYFTGKMSNPQDGSERTMKVTFTVNPKTQHFTITKLTVDGVDHTDSSTSIMKQICAGKKEIYYWQ